LFAEPSAVHSARANKFAQLESATRRINSYNFMGAV
jgi:hypothetical protein